MSRKRQFFFISTMMLLVAVACQLSDKLVPTSPARPTQLATILPLSTLQTILPTPTVSAGIDLQTLFPSFSLTDPNAVCVAHSYYALSCLDAAGWHVYNNGYNETTHPTSTIPNKVFGCPDGRIYLVDDTIYRVEGETLTDIGGYVDVGTLACGPGNEVWVSGMDIISHFDGSTWTSYSAEEFFSGAEADYTYIYSMAIAPNGNVWVTAANQIATFDGTGWKSISPPVNPYFPDSMGRGKGLVIDSTGTVWAITYPETCCIDSQLSKYDGIQWTTIASPEPETEYGPEHELIYIAADHEDTIWAVTSTSTRNAEIYTLNTQSSNWEFQFDIRQLGLGKTIYGLSMQFDGQDRLWLTTDYGLGIYDGSTWTTYHLHTANIYSNDISNLSIFADGPNLPALEVKPPGSILGKLVSRTSRPFTDAQVEICLEPAYEQFSGDTPCADQAYHKLADVNTDGSFVIPNVPIGDYYLMIKLSNSWGQMIHSGYSLPGRDNAAEFIVESGEATQLDEISTP